MGFIEHHWYCWLDRMFVGKTLSTVGKKVLVDQLVCAPGIGLWYFLGENFRFFFCLKASLLYTYTLLNVCESGNT